MGSAPAQARGGTRRGHGFPGDRPSSLFVLAPPGVGGQPDRRMVGCRPQVPSRCAAAAVLWWVVVRPSAFGLRVPVTEKQRWRWPRCRICPL